MSFTKDRELDRSRLIEVYTTLEGKIEDQKERIKIVQSLVKISELSKTKEAVSKLAKILKSFSSTQRIYILLLTKEIVTFNLELEQILGISQPKANHHIQKLVNTGIIHKHKEGRTNILSITQLGKVFGYFANYFINERL